MALRAWLRWAREPGPEGPPRTGAWSDGARAPALAPHGAIAHLPAGAPAAPAAGGLDDLDAFTLRLLNTVCPEETP
ncbi:hypothetical protein [Streptomyces sp. NPDC001568]|uniref:hypothetical protein n=1 Tax=Streptomyces sp. NPDC001568 TaxID=3364588 RepID=UPI0036867F48